MPQMASPIDQHASNDTLMSLEKGRQGSADSGSSEPDRKQSPSPSSHHPIQHTEPPTTSEKRLQSPPTLDWDGPDDPDNPLNWSMSKKAYHTFIPPANALVCTIASSIITPGLDDIQRVFHVSAEVSLLPYVLYVLGLAAGPLLAGPCSEHFGRRAVYFTGMPMFALFILGAGFSNNIASLIICRFFAGVFGSPGLTIGGATLSDIWLPKDRAIPWAIYVTTPFLGPTIGPLVGGFVVLGTDWRWTQWTILFFTVAAFGPTLGMSETYKSIILRRRAKMRGEASAVKTGPWFNPRAIHTFVTKLLTRPIHMALTEPVVGLFSLYIALNFGMVYGFFAAFPYVFAEAYNFEIGSTGLMFLGLGIGSLVGCGIMMVFARVIFRPQVIRARELGKEVPPEKRLYLAMMGSVCLPVSLFWFAWSVQARVHWICPVIAEGVFGCGNLLIFMAATLYIMDFYGPLYGASANGANNLARYSVAAAFPLFIVQIYKALGTGWATSLLGFISVLLMPIPWAFYVYGPRFRQNSGYAKA